ncbi:uncharacterized protein BDZ99DRAFT_516435 [Mytilinidion resinicola]|uniref:Uncharacterized protein n=1 Tax=Mytilinidion resinicola TaxID=574789 RepID=A0A6A6YXU8_9PEZI|nr:uncharacterized protein BDZ99DRAFT_516435 [Mytilinidion resinicola]KAF2813786.1 hypothetical protein BDZ99DRAFT_516435 [Mytilinidion resinicola]
MAEPWEMRHRKTLLRGVVSICYDGLQGAGLGIGVLILPGACIRGVSNAVAEFPTQPMPLTVERSPSYRIRQPGAQPERSGAWERLQHARIHLHELHAFLPPLRSCGPGAVDLGDAAQDGGSGRWPDPAWAYGALVGTYGGEQRGLGWRC